MDNNFKNRENVFIIAEISANHGQRLDIARRMITEAKECGVDAVKFQAYTPDTLTIDCDNVFFQIKHEKWGGKTLYQLYGEAYTPWEWLKDLKKETEDSGLFFLCTAFDKTSVDRLEDIGVSAHKISSFELVDLDLIAYAASARKPLFISTGMSDIYDISSAVDTARKNHVGEVILFKCVSSYPAKPEEMNLRTIKHMEHIFNCCVGLSDHTLDIGASIAAVAVGAKVIEKHFTLSRSFATPDSFFSINPIEMRSLVSNIRIAEKALGKVSYGITSEEKNNVMFGRSLFVVSNIEKGEVFTRENIRSIRPSYGLKPKHMDIILGKKAKCDIKRGTPLSFNLID